MIAWMQKHNKYLVVTIWIATIAFIGAGFVGWGTYQYGSKASAIAKVGDVEISQGKFNFVYQNTYNSIRDKMQGNFDDAKAKEMGLTRMVFEELLNQARLLNLAKEYGVIVSDDELAKAIASNRAFMQDGKFSKKIYQIYLRNIGLKPKAFENIVRDDLRVKKLLKLLNQRALDYEVDVIGSIINLKDKIKFSLVKKDDMLVAIDKDKLKAYWSKNKNRFKTQKVYKLAIHWTKSDDINATDDELMKFYQKNSYNYLDKDGKELSFKDAKDKVLIDYRIKKAKKRALLEQITIKKGKAKIETIKELPVNDPTLSANLWQEILAKDKGTLLKPRVVGNKYATIKIIDIIEPRVMSFEEAKKLVTQEFKEKKKRELLDRKIKNLLVKGKFEKESGFISFSNYDSIPELKKPQKMLLAKAVFSSFDKKGSVDLGDSIAIFEIIEQKLGKNIDKNIAIALTNNLKSSEFEGRLVESLIKKYEVQTFARIQ
jgi:peptidyl-prolyl cis-trans isomerase D